MAWNVWGKPFNSGELSDTTHYQTTKFNGNYILNGLRTTIIVFDDPVFTDLNCKIYSDKIVGGDHTPDVLLYTSSDVREKSEIHTLESGIKEIYFTFNYEHMEADTYYNFVINGTGYSPTAGSYLAWMKGWPDPVYRTGLTPTTSNIGNMPYHMYYIGAEL